MNRYGVHPRWRRRDRPGGRPAAADLRPGLAAGRVSDQIRDRPARPVF